MGFNYEKFEKELFAELERYAKSLLEQKEDIYIMSIDYWHQFTTTIGFRANTLSYLATQSNQQDEDYLYYKYCEEEWDWDIFGNLEDLSLNLQIQYKETEEKCGDDYDLYDEMKSAHTEQIIKICKQVLKEFKQTEIYKSFPNLFLTVYVREYFSDEAIMNNFAELNGETAAEEYAKWL